MTDEEEKDEDDNICKACGSGFSDEELEEHMEEEHDG